MKEVNVYMETMSQRLRRQSQSDSDGQNYEEIQFSAEGVDNTADPENTVSSETIAPEVTMTGYIADKPQIEEEAKIEFTEAPSTSIEKLVTPEKPVTPQKFTTADISSPSINPLTNSSGKKRKSKGERNKNRKSS